jgi:hypothetical protein
MAVTERRSGHSRRRPRREREPEGFGEAVAAGAVILALMTSIAFVGFAWERSRERSAQAFATDLVERLARDGSDAAVPRWTGPGQGPQAETARATFDALRDLGGFSAGDHGGCRLETRFAVCPGTRYRCRVTGETPAGPVDAALGLCRENLHQGWSFDYLDLTVPPGGGEGNRSGVERDRDGLIRYGDTPPPPELMPPRSRRRGFAMPFAW